MTDEARKEPIDPEEHRFVLPIESMHVRRFVYASTDDNPIYFSDEAAQAAGYKRAVAPPTFVSSMLDYVDGPAEDDLKEDGVAKDLFPKIVKPDALLMGGGQDIDFLAPVYQGDVVTVTRRVVDFYKRPSARFGELNFIVMVSEGVNQDGTTVIRIRDTLIAKQ